MDAIRRFFREASRRRVIANAALYVVGAWVVIQVASEAIEAGILRVALRDVFVAAFLGFPVALIVSWFYDITRRGLERTSPACADESYDQSLNTRDYAALSALFVAWVLAVFLVHTPPAIEKSIAILPFENPGLDPENEMFAYGIRVDLQTQLQKIGEIKIIARESSDRVDATLPLSQLGLRLGAAYIMKGSVERALGQVRISVILIDAESETQAFTRAWDRDVSARNWFDIRNEITDNIVRSLRAELSPDDRRRLRNEPTQNLAALNAYGQGMRNKGTRTVGSLANAIERFQDAIELDPEFALAYVGYADSLYLYNLYSKQSVEEIIPDMKEAIDDALAINDELGEAYVTRAVIERIENGDTSVAENYFLKALDLSPNYPVAHQWYGAFLGSTGRRELGLVSKQRAWSLDPESGMLAYDIGFTLMNMGRNDEAIAQFEAAIELDPDIPGPYERIGDVHLARGKLVEAATWQRKAIARDPKDPFGPVLLGEIYLDLGDIDRAREWFDRAAKLVPPEFPLLESLREPLLLRQGKLDEAYESGQLNIQRFAEAEFTLTNLRNHDLRNGRFETALARYEDAIPGLFARPEAAVDEDNVDYAIDVALVWQRMGEHDRAAELLDKAEQVLVGSSSGDLSSTDDIRYVLILAIRGDRKAALGALRQTLDSGWRARWWIYLELDPALDSIRDDPEFQSMLQEVRDDMASQLARLRDIDADGSLDSG